MLQTLFRPLAALMLIVLMACAPPLVDANTAANLRVRTVTVDTSGVKDIKGRMYSVPPATIDADLTAALQQKLAAGPAGNADITVTVTTLRLVSRVQAWAVGGTSYIDGVVRVTDVVTGKDILPPTRVVGASQRFRVGGIIGAVTSPTAENDYHQTINGFAANVAKRLLPKPAKAKPAASP